MTVSLSPVGGVAIQFFDANGTPLAGGKLYTYAAGTTTPQATYTTSAGSVQHANPIVLDSAGRIPSGGEVWLTDGDVYKFVLCNATDVTIATYDNISGINSKNAFQIDYTPPFTGGQATTIGARLALEIFAKDFGAVGNGTTDNALAINTALQYLSGVGGGTLQFGPGTYLVGDTILLPSNCAMKGAGQKVTTLKLKGGTNKNILQAYGGSAVGAGLYDMTVDGNQNSNTQGGVYLIGATDQRGPSFQIERVIFTHLRTAVYGAGNRGCVAITGNTWSVLRDCDFINNDYAQIALFLGTADSVVDGIFIGTNGRSYGSTSYGLWLSSNGNFFTNCYFGGTQGGPQVYLYDASNNKFTSCIIDNAGTDGLKMEGSSAYNQFIGGQIGNSSYSDGGTYYAVVNNVSNSYALFVGVTIYNTYATAPAKYGYYESPGVDGKAQLIGCQFNGGWVTGAVGLPNGSTTTLLGCQGYTTSTVSTLKALARVDIQAPAAGAPSVSVTPALRVNNGGTISIWAAAYDYNYAWVQAIQDDGSNTLKNLWMQPLGGQLKVGGNGGGITVTSPDGLVTKTISINNSGAVVAV